MNLRTTRWTMIPTRQNRRHNEKEKETVRSDRLLFRWQENENSKEGEKMSKSVAPVLPFECVVGTQPETITNPYSGESVKLSPEAVAVYDTIKGAEMLGNYDTVGKGLDWFRQYYPDEYMKLLD